MTEFQELVKDAPKFASMERGELVAYAYGMYAAGAKTDAENAKLRDERDHYKALWEHVHVTDAELRRVRAAWKKDREQIAKLRWLCAGLLTGYECGHGELCKGCTWDGLGDPKTFPCLQRVKARELGIEVPE